MWSSLSLLGLAACSSICSATSISSPLALYGRHTAGLSADKLAKVRGNAYAITNQSWEYGTLLEAFTELEWPSLSVFAGQAVNTESLNSWSPIATDVVALATQIVNNKNPGELPLIDGAGATGDPASIGSAVLLTNWTLPRLLEDKKFAVAAEEQLYYLLNVAPRGDNGVISQRVSQVQLWSDAVYMFPPFLAYYGALQSNYSLLYESYKQVKLYRETLLDPNGTGLWRHIELGTSTDNHLWGTGNGWAAMGMMRVLQTIADSDFSEELRSEQDELEWWIGDLLDATWKYQGENGTLFNYVNDLTSISDTSTTAMIASATYRFATFNDNRKHIEAADKGYQLVVDSINGDGWLLNAVDPLLWNVHETPGSWSPEAQSFVLLVHAAWRDFHAARV